MQQTYFAAHGMTSRNTTVQVDGMMMNSTRGDNQVNPYFNDAMSQEISYETTGAGADVSAGGVRINMIPREGGNRFSGALFSAWSDGAWQADNLTQDLKDQGLTAVDKIDKIYDFNFSIGGPVQAGQAVVLQLGPQVGRQFAGGRRVLHAGERARSPSAMRQCKTGDDQLRAGDRRPADHQRHGRA